MTQNPNHPVAQLPAVGRIQGIDLQRSTTAALSKVELQYTGLDGRWYALHMPFLDAQYLLNLLEEMAKRGGFEHLRRPPAGPTQ